MSFEKLNCWAAKRLVILEIQTRGINSTGFVYIGVEQIYIINLLHKHWDGAIHICSISKLTIAIQAPALDIVCARIVRCDQDAGMILANGQLPGTRNIENRLWRRASGRGISSQLSVGIGAPALHSAIT